MNKRLALVLLVACGDATTTPPSQLNLDRPRDITFACYGGLRITDGRTTGTKDDEVTLSAQPTTACDIRSGEHATGTPAPVPPGQEDLSADGGGPVGSATWFGFILQSGPGTVAIASFQTKPAIAFTGGDVGVLDADPLTPGKNSISVGEDPVALTTDAVGCHVVTANAGSCDLSVLDIASAVDNNPDTPIDVKRMNVTNAAGARIRAKPAAMVGEPAIDVIGKTCPATASGLVYIAYPGCHLVAAVDTSTGQIVNGIQYIAGVPTVVDGNVTCPDECSGEATTTGIRPVALDLQRDPRSDIGGVPGRTRRLVIGADNSSSFTLVELDQTTTLPLSLSQIALEDNTPTHNLGVSAVTLSPTIGMGGSIHVVNDETAAGGQAQYVYAITTDNTIRVADVFSLRKECDTQVDPRYLRANRSVKSLSCLPVGDPLTPQRRANARGPGIDLTTDAVPTSVAIIKSVPIDGDSRSDQDPSKLIGYFAMITAANGATFIVNVDDDDAPDLFDLTHPLNVPMNIAIAHQLRDSIGSRGELATTTVDNTVSTLCDIGGPTDTAGNVLGGPRATTPPTRNIPAGIFAPEKVNELPNMRQFQCVGTDSTKAVSELQFTAPEAVRDLVFPDLKALFRDENWTLTWEGSLSGDTSSTAIDGPQIRESQIFVDNDASMRIVDQTRPFCDAGVEPFDIVQLRGCDPAVGNTDCPIGYRCFVHPNSLVSGLGACMLDDEADRLADSCKDFLTSLRRYTVGRSESGELQLLPRRTVLRTTPLDGCTSDAQCKVLADYAIKNQSSQPPVDDTSAEDKHVWKCESDASRTGSINRCEMRCDATADCFAGTVCEGAIAGSPASGHCMEGVIPPQACVNAPQRFEVRASDAFAVLGTRSGFVHATIADAGGKCIRDPAANPLDLGRIPLVASACDPASDPLTGKKLDGTFEPNPCSLTAATTDVVPLYLPGTCTLGNPATELRERQAPAIRYRNRGITLTIVDPFYAGDQTCILDRAGTLGKIPHVFTGYQLTFHQVGGFAPITLPITPSFPTKVVRGPTNSIWVIDEGDFLSTSISQPSTRGKVFRIEPHALGLVNVLE